MSLSWSSWYVDSPLIPQGGKNSHRLTHLSAEDLCNQHPETRLTCPDIFLWCWLMWFPLYKHHRLTATQLLQGLLSEQQRMEGMDRVSVCFLVILIRLFKISVSSFRNMGGLFWRLTGLYRGHTYHTKRRPHMSNRNPSHWNACSPYTSRNVIL